LITSDAVGDVIYDGNR